jgi:uncharacterized protein YndB with AHSA1/START domain
MPRDKDRKRIIRDRMKKTGESYTAARAHVITSQTNAAARPPRVVNHAALAGMSDERISAKTGRTWAQWVDALDSDGAAAMPHGRIATIVHDKYGAPDWWAQTVTVGYERIKGLRERGQRRDGSYEATKSRTFNVPVSTLFRAWADAAKRRRWLDGSGAVVRSATAAKAMRLRWPDGTIVIVGFTAKGKSKSMVAIAHTKLRSREASRTAKEYWAARFDALASLLAASPSSLTA